MILSTLGAVAAAYDDNVASLGTGTGTVDRGCDERCQGARLRAAGSPRQPLLNVDFYLDAACWAQRREVADAELR